MIDWLTQLLTENPSYVYLIVAGILVLCGLGLPLPEEIVLVAAGFVCYQEDGPNFLIMMAACATGVLLGDLLPFVLGKLFGPRLLRLRWMRMVINKDRLATFDRWFRRRGDSVILIARFIPGLRVVAFFTGGTMQMRWSRFAVITSRISNSRSMTSRLV